jgi:tRNA pseudouridine38-40 synthase
MSVQQALEEAIFKFCGEGAAVQGAGRTDAGVHALGQVAHVDIDKPSVGDTVRDAINFHIRPWPVAVLNAQAVGPQFHARFDAIARRYRYRIVNRRAPLALEQGRAWLVNLPLDADAMHGAARLLLGEHDFSAFRTVQCQAKHPVRTLQAISESRLDDQVIVDVQANAFLHHMVRNIVGSLVPVGRGEQPPSWLAQLLQGRDRSVAGPTAPAEGLVFLGPKFPGEWNLPAEVTL